MTKRFLCYNSAPRYKATRLAFALPGIALLSCFPYPATAQDEVLDLNGTWQTTVGPRTSPTTITLGIKQQGRNVSVIHLDGFLTPARGAELLHGTLEGMKIVSRRQNPKGELVLTELPVDNPDEIVYEQAKFLRISRPPAGNPVCEASNRFQVQPKYAVSRGAQLREAKNLGQAVCWYKIAADLGYPSGLQGLAYAYWKGEGVPQDYKRALELDQAAADKGDAVAQSDLAYAYTNGLGVAKDPQKAAYWNAKVDAQIRQKKAQKAAADAEEQRRLAPYRALTGAVGSVLAPFDGRPPSGTSPPPQPVAAAPQTGTQTGTEGARGSPAEVVLTVKGMAGGSDDLHVFGGPTLIPEGTPFTLVYTFDDSKGEAYGIPNCPDWGSGINGSQKGSPGAAVLTIRGKSYTFGKGVNAKSGVWRKITTKCSQSEIGIEVSEGQWPNGTGVNTRVHAPAGSNSLTQTKDWRTAATLDNVNANDPNNIFRIAVPNQTGITTRGVLRVKSIEVSGPHPLSAAAATSVATAPAPASAPATVPAPAPAAVLGPAPKKIYVLSRARGTRITTYTPDGKPSTPTIPLGGCNCGGLAVDALGRIYVGNNGPRDHVIVFQADGTRIGPSLNLGIGALGLSLDRAGTIFVVGNARGQAVVKSFMPNGAATGLTVNTGFDLAQAVAVDAAGKIYVGGRNNDMVKTFDAVGHPATPTIRAGVNTPSAIAVGPDGRIYVANFLNVTTYLPSGDRVQPTLGYRSPDGNVPTPSAVAVGGDGNIYVGYYSAGGKSVVVVFRPDGKPAGPPIVTPEEIAGIAVQ